MMPKRKNPSVVSAAPKTKSVSRFLDNYAGPDRNTCVRAEIQVPKHFYANKMRFAVDDPYIAISKPACFFCLLYLHHHPADVVEPVSHKKIYLNWRSPDFSNSVGRIGPYHQRDILNAMNQEIRKEALRQIDEKSAPDAWHPESMTGVTQSARYEEIRGSVDDFNIALGVENDAGMCSQGLETPAAVGAADASLFKAIMGGKEDVRGQQCNPTVHIRENNLQGLMDDPEECVSDYDEGGGIQIECSR